MTIRRRQPHLGHYNATRDVWQRAYRKARIRNARGAAPDPSRGGIGWKAQLIVQQRSAIDPLTTPVSGRLWAKRAIDEILQAEADMSHPKTTESSSSRRPDITKARAAIEAFLDEHVPGYPEYSLCEDGDDDSAENKCGWAFWIAPMDTTSYLHEDLTIEWYGTMWPDDYVQDEETGQWLEVQ